MRLGGLGIDRPESHGALCSTLERLGIGTANGTKLPKLVVLDWSVVSNCSAEGLAFFSVLARHLVGSGVHVIATEPELEDIREVLVQSGIRARCDGVAWVSCATSGRPSVRSGARAALFTASWDASVDDFCDDLSATLVRLAVPRRARCAVMGTTHEMLHNVFSHAGARYGGATALLFPGRRPKVLQIGIADDGLGIAATVLRHPRHEWLGWFSDARVTGAVLRDSLTGRGAESGEEAGGGGLARIVKRLLSETTCKIIVRSGAALIVLRSGDADRFVPHRLTYGTGTQLRLELQLT